MGLKGAGTNPSLNIKSPHPLPAQCQSHSPRTPSFPLIIIIFDPVFLTAPLIPFHTMQRNAIKAIANFCNVQFAAH